MVFGNKYSRIVLISAHDFVRTLYVDGRVAQESDARKRSSVLTVLQTGDIRFSQRDGRAWGNGDLLVALELAGQNIALLRFVVAGQLAEINHKSLGNTNTAPLPRFAVFRPACRCGGLYSSSSSGCR